MITPEVALALAVLQGDKIAAKLLADRVLEVFAEGATLEPEEMTLQLRKIKGKKYKAIVYHTAEAAEANPEIYMRSCRAVRDLIIDPDISVAGVVYVQKVEIFEVEP